MKQFTREFNRKRRITALLIALGCLMMAQNVVAKNEVTKRSNGRFNVAANKVLVQALCAQFAQHLKVPVQIGVTRGEKVTANLSNVKPEMALRAVAKDVRIVYAVDPVAKTFKINRVGCFSKGHPSAAGFGGNPNSVGLEVDPKALANASKGP